MADLKIAVIGSGVVGVTTAIELKKNIKNADVNIVADAFYEDTTSWVAAGIFRPGCDFTAGNEETTQKWINDSWYYWKNIQDSVHGAEAGVTELSGYIFSNNFEKEVRNSLIEKLVPIYRAATEKELSSVTSHKWKYGSFFSTLVIDNSFYLPWALNKFELGGGKIINEHVKSLSQLGEKFDIIVNCSGLGAQTLCNDQNVVPIRGQVIKVDAPWMKMFWYANSETYVIPGFKSVTLGGCREFGSYNREIDDHMTARILENCYDLVPSLKQSKQIKTVVGLRPYRKPVRLEKEILVSGNGKRIQVVHNYGHGGYGVTAAPGTSLHAVQLVKEIWTGNSKL